MAKRKRPTKSAQPTTRKTNWLLIGGVIVAVLLVVGLLALAFREPDPSDTSLATYCEENPSNCIVKGQDDAPVTVVEVSDYGCGHCRNFNLDTAGLVDDLLIAPGDVRYIIVPYALQSQTAPPAEASLCANDQDRFFDYHIRLFQLQGTPGLYDSAGLLGVAEELGLDQDTFESCISTGKYAGVVQSNIRAASLAGVNSTPTFFFNDEKFAGNRPLTFFQQQVSQLMESSDAN
jgi:protein-disulfide isomerase